MENFHPFITREKQIRHCKMMYRMQKIKKKNQIIYQKLKNVCKLECKMNIIFILIRACFVKVSIANFRWKSEGEN